MVPEFGNRKRGDIRDLVHKFRSNVFVLDLKFVLFGLPNANVYVYRITGAFADFGSDFLWRAKIYMVYRGTLPKLCI